MRPDAATKQWGGQELHRLFAAGEETLQRFLATPAPFGAYRFRSLKLCRAFGNLVQNQLIHFDLLALIPLPGHCSYFQ